MLCLVMEAMDVLKGSVQQLAGNGRTARMAGTEADTRPKPPLAAASMLYEKRREANTARQWPTGNRLEGRGAGRRQTNAADGRDTQRRDQ